MPDTTTATTRGWRKMERYAYAERPYEDVWGWLAGHLSTLGDPLPGGDRSVELRIRPVGKEVSRAVRLHVGGLVCGDSRARAALRWGDAARPRLFPELTAILEIAPVPNDDVPFTQFGILARYRPPLGPLGAIGDRLVGAEVTDAALTTFLDELAQAAEEQLAPPSPPGRAGRAAGRPGDDDPAIRRLFLTLDGLAVRPGGAVGAGQALAATPGVVHVSLDPWTGLAAVDHDPARCGSQLMMAALEEQAAPRPVG